MAVQLSKAYLLDKYRLEPDKRQLYLDGASVHLTPRPFQVLVYLIENRDRVVMRQELLDQFWDGHDVYEDTLRKCIGAIRKALNDRANQARFVETHYAGGYRFIGSVEELIDSSSIIEVEKTRGLRVVIKEEISDKSEAVPASAASTKRRGRRFVALLSLIAVVGLTASGFMLLRHSRKAESNTDPALFSSIAVLPLKNLSNEEAQEFLSDGLTETLITELSRIDGLKVISRNSVFSFKGKESDPREIGKQLDVSTVLEGSVRKSGDSVRVDVRLVSTTDGRVIWTADNYHRAVKDLLAVQDEIACGIAAGLRVKFCSETDTAKRYTTNVDAYQAYLKGRYFWNKRTAEGIKQSLEYYERAILIDPDYALAYAGAAESYIQGVWHVPFDPKDAVPKARAAALKAINLDDRLAEAHTALATVYQMEWKWAEAGNEIDRAISLNPRLARAYHVQAFHLDMMGRHPEAVAAIKQAQALDPLNMVINADTAMILWTAGQSDQALAQALKVVEMDQGFVFGHQRLSQLYEYVGRDEEAAEEYFRAMTLSGKSDGQVRAYRRAFAKNGMRGIYQRELDERLQEQTQGVYSTPIFIAELYTRVGQKELALKYMDIAYRQRSAEICYLKQFPIFFPLRSDPRFQDLLRRIGLDN